MQIHQLKDLLKDFDKNVIYDQDLKKNKPEYIYIKDKELGAYSDDEKVVKVIAGKYKDIEGPEKNHNVEPIYFHVVLKNEKEFACEVPELSLIHISEPTRP